MEKNEIRKERRLRFLRRFRNLGWALTTIGGGIMELPGSDMFKRIAVYSIVGGTIISVGSQALINEIDDMDGDLESLEILDSWTVYRN
jgi:hypothetical protein